MNVELLKSLYQELSKDIKSIATKVAIYYNKKRLKGSTLKEEDLVYLL
jgi:hypothetical protein